MLVLLNYALFFGAGDDPVYFSNLIICVIQLAYKFDQRLYFFLFL